MKNLIQSARICAVLFGALLVYTNAAQAQSGFSEHAKTPPSAPQQEEGAPAAADTPEAAEAPAAEPAQGEASAAADTGNPVGVSTDWNTDIKEAPPQASQFGGAPDQTEVIEKINVYFNTLPSLQGDFLQTDPDGKTKKGDFYLERPGKVRFDYSPPSKQKIISDGEYLAIEDHDLRTTDRYALSSTPFRLLLKEQVDLANDAQILAMDIGEDIVVVTLEDKENRGRGQIRLFFSWPEIELKEWIISDAQGLDTRIQLGNLETGEDVDPQLFTFSSELGLPDFRN